MLLSGGAATAAVGGTLGTTASQPTSAASQPGVYGYGGSGAVQSTEAALAATTLQTVTETEPNDERATAMQISPGVSVDANLDAATVDWFAFDAAAGDPITVEYNRDGAVGVTGLVVYAPDGSFKEKLFVGTDTTQQLSTTAETTGTHYLQVMDVEGGDGPYTTSVFLVENPDSGGDDSTTGTGQTPYGGSMRSIPGRVQAEEFDEDGFDVAYFDTSEQNNGGEFRPDEYVDIEQSGDSTNKYNVGYTEAGEWLEYSVDATAGSYQLAARVATTRDGRQFAVSLDGNQVATVDVPNTGGWYTWETVTVDGVEVAADGPQILRIEFVDSAINLNWIEFTNNQQDDDYGTQTYGEYEYGGISA